MADKEPQNVLVYEPDKSLQNQLSSFLMDKVFVEDDDGKCSHSSCYMRKTHTLPCMKVILTLTERLLY